MHQGAKKNEIEQQSYATDILEESSYANAKPRSTPWDQHLPELEEPLDKAGVGIYRRVVGQIMYLNTMTRPDLVFMASRLASGFQKPTKGQWERMKRALCYLNGTRNAHIEYKKSREPQMPEAFVDTSYGVDKVRCKSIMGYVICLGGGPILWRRHLQPTVAVSENYELGEDMLSIV